MMGRMIVPAAVLAVGFAVAAQAADVAKGKQVFNSATPKCTGCHTDAKNPLTKTGAENTREELKAWMRTPKDMLTKKGKKGVMPAYTPQKLSDADLDALVDYLATMK